MEATALQRAVLSIENQSFLIENESQRGKIKKLNRIRPIFGFSARIELETSKLAKNTLLKSAKTFHYRQAHSENFHFFIVF